jgi:hypothetical protein
MAQRIKAPPMKLPYGAVRRGQIADSAPRAIQAASGSSGPRARAK